MRKGDELPLRNYSLARTLMENSQTAKIVGLSFTAGVAVGWFLHSYMLKANSVIDLNRNLLVCLLESKGVAEVPE